jgi:glycosyltransferase involved in cell wall biosynthesis
MPLVSVIVNVRNGASTLREALASVMAQTFSDWEVIVWDDCSTDGSANIVARFSAPRIRYFRSPEETSLGKARDNAIRQARGEWLAFLDQDDVWLPRKLEMQMALANQNAAIIYGRTVRFYPSGMERDYDQAHEFTLLPEDDIFTQLFSDGCFIAMSSACFRRSAVEEIGGISETIQIIPDYYLYTALARDYRARAVQEPVCRYRMHAGNMSRQTAIHMHREALGLINHWADSLPAQIALRSRNRHSLYLALSEMQALQTARAGILRLLRDVSLPFLFTRPFVYLFHVLRRRVMCPYWKRAASGHDRDSAGSDCGTSE